MPSVPDGAAHGGRTALSTPRLRVDTPERAGLDPVELDLLADEVRSSVTGPRPWASGAVVIAGRGPVVAVEEAAGWAVRYSAYDAERDAGVELPPQSRLRMTVDTPCDLASLTKLFTAVATAQQMERGAVDMDAPIGTYLPEFTGVRACGVTVRHLLTHTSGLRPELPLHDCPDDAARMALLRAEEPLDRPGSAYRYSDLNPLLLQFVLERVTGRTLDALIQDCVTRPLGMLSTTFGPCPGAAATEDQRRPWAKADRGMLRGVVHDENAWALGGVAGHAGLFSTARDLAVFCRALLSGGSYGTARILGPAYVDLLLSPPGLGFMIDQPYFMGELAGRGAAGHTGFTGTSLVLDRATDTFLVLLANSVHPRRRPADHRVRARAATRLSRAVRGRCSGGTSGVSGISGGSGISGVPGALGATGL